MKSLTNSFVALFIFSFSAFAGQEWSYYVEEGEDATSTHYYFYESNGDSIQRVRWVWNGGAQNAPTVTEYLLGSGKITIRHLIGKRDDVAALVVGRDAKLELKKEYSIAAKSSAEMLIPEPPDKSLSDVQRVDLKNLINLLAKERKPFKPKAQQVMDNAPRIEWKNMNPEQLREHVTNLNTLSDVEKILGQAPHPNRMGEWALFHYKVTETLRLTIACDNENILSAKDPRPVRSIFLFEINKDGHRAIWSIRKGSNERDGKFRSDQIDIPAASKANKT